MALVHAASDGLAAHDHELGIRNTRRDLLTQLERAERETWFVNHQARHRYLRKELPQVHSPGCLVVRGKSLRIGALLDGTGDLSTELWIFKGGRDASQHVREDLPLPFACDRSRRGDPEIWDVEQSRTRNPRANEHEMRNQRLIPGRVCHGRRSAERDACKRESLQVELVDNGLNIVDPRFQTQI